MRELKERFLQLLCRFRYPVSLPEEVAAALGVSLSNRLSFEEFINLLTSPQCQPSRLKKFMPRDMAEAAFQSAIRKECFPGNSLFSYYFSSGWLEFVLHFDDQSRLRRMYLVHQHLQGEDALEIPLPTASVDHA